MRATRTATLDFPTIVALRLRSYERTHRSELDDDPAFAAWLEDEYIPLAGGWHY